MSTSWIVYIIQTSEGKLYTGITNNLERRFAAHQSGRAGARFFHFDKPEAIVYQETLPGKSEALKRECAIKKMNRCEKLKLISPFIFTTLDPSIRFEPIFHKNWFQRGKHKYALIARDETCPSPIPGYAGKQCVVEKELGEALKRVQNNLLPLELCLKVYDCYRPKQAVDHFTKWTELPDTPLAKKYHYPNVEKKDLHDLSFLSRTSSHARGTAVDVTLCPIKPAPRKMPKNFLGVWDPESLDMGVGYLCFDELSWGASTKITKQQQENRFKLQEVMMSEGFSPLDTEFWHFYYRPERNPHLNFSFPILDDPKKLF